ncbi:MAG: DUF167 domain-containing protein [Patescibacteria group bacterium]
MRITVNAKPGSRAASVKLIEPDRYEIAVTQLPEKGKANDAIRRALAKHLRVAPSRLSLLMGVTSRIKVFELQ